MELVIASNNENKIREIGAILKPYFSDIISSKEAGFNGIIQESGTTFYENALLKARAVCDATNRVVLADDSGLYVYALGGEPGIYSARYAGDNATDMQNNIKLLERMQNETKRNCKFICSMVLLYPNGNIITGEGIVEGELLYDIEGNNGFGYDCIFYSTELKKSFGMATQEEKNKISHRYKALMNIVYKLNNK